MRIFTAQTSADLDERGPVRCNAAVRSRMPRALVYFFAFAAAIAVLVAVRFALPPIAIVSPLAIQPTPAAEPAAPTPPPASEPAPPLTDLLGIVLYEQPNYPTTQPLDLPADLPDAARIELSSPAYLDGVGNLWITNPNGQPIADVLARPLTGHTFIVKEKVLCVSWPVDGGSPDVFYRTDAQTITGLLPPTDDGPAKTQRFGDEGIDFGKAIRFGRLTVAPAGYKIALLGGKASPDYVNLQPIRTDAVLAQSPDTLYAWQPWENGRDGGAAVSIDADGKAADLTAATGWADKIIQLAPLADGSVLIVSRGENGIELKLKPAANAQALTPEQTKLVHTLGRQLADADPVVREQTQRQLESLGPTIYPELEALRQRVPAEAQVRIETLLGERLAPTLAGLHPLDGACKTLARFRDGGCVLQLTGGGTTAESGDEQTVIPAYIAIRPGRFVQRLDLAAVANFDPAKYKLTAAGEEWVIVDPVAGPERWIGSKTYPLVDPLLKDYDDLLGIDAQHRWIFRSSKRPGKTLIIDPALPDTTPRLPTWTIDAPDGVGWTNFDWPAVKRGEKIFVLGENGWRLPGDGESWQTTVPTPAATQEDGATTFRVVDLLLKVDSTNAVTRYRNRDGVASTGTPEAVFKDGLPRDTPRRIWLDPAGRLVFAGEQLTVTFPNGRVPKSIGDLMLRSTR